MQIYQLTKPELELCENLCNFTDDEMTYFRERSKQKSHIQIGIANFWSDSKVSSLSRSVKIKIKKILKDF